jgi:hypothetical protein
MEPSVVLVGMVACSDRHLTCSVDVRSFVVASKPSPLIVFALFISAARCSVSVGWSLECSGNWQCGPAPESKYQIFF